GHRSAPRPDTPSRTEVNPGVRSAPGGAARVTASRPPVTMAIGVRLPLPGPGWYHPRRRHVHPDEARDDAEATLAGPADPLRPPRVARPGPGGRAKQARLAPADAGGRRRSEDPDLEIRR